MKVEVRRRAGDPGGTGTGGTLTVASLGLRRAHSADLRGRRGRGHWWHLWTGATAARWDRPAPSGRTLGPESAWTLLRSRSGVWRILQWCWRCVTVSACTVTVPYCNCISTCRAGKNLFINDLRLESNCFTNFKQNIVFVLFFLSETNHHVN